MFLKTTEKILKNKFLLKLNLQKFADNEPPAPEPPKPEPPKPEPAKEDMPKWATSFLTELKQTLKPESNSGTTKPPADPIPVPKPPTKPNVVEADPEKPKPKKQGFLDWLL